MSFNCKCIHCGDIFVAKRSTAKFCSPTCRKQYARDKNKKKSVQIKRLSKKTIKGVPKKVDIKVDDKIDDKSGFIPNWKAAGFKSKDEAMIKAIGDIAALKFPNTSIMWKGQHFLLNPTKKPIGIKKKRKRK